MRRVLRFSVAFACVATLVSARVLAAPPRKPKPRPHPPAPPPSAEPAPAKPATEAAQPGIASVTVVEIAGGSAYLKPGSSAGVRRGSRVTIGRHEYVVVSTSSSYAEIDTGNAPIREGATGTATTLTAAEDRPKQLPPPTPIEKLRGEFRPWHPPAESQHPKPVPLGVPDRDRRYDVLLYGYFGGVRSLGAQGGGSARGEIGMRAHIEPIAAPVALDVDGAVQRWFGPGIYDREGARPTLRVRELQLGLGNPSGYFAGLGRIKYAASTLGALDGLRARAPLGSDVSIAAFGGTVPDPLNGEVSTAAQRFGAEVAFSKPEVQLRPEAALVVHGSTFDGHLDERRLAGFLGIYPGASRAGAHFEVSAFDKANPWGVNPLELTAAGLDGTVRAGIFEFGARLDMRQQERSLWLASFLPPSWFCVTAPGPAPAAGQPPSPETCTNTSLNTRYMATLDASMTTEHVGVSISGTTMRNPFVSGAPTQSGVFASARVLRIARVFRVEGTGTASTGTYMDLFSGSLGPGVSVLGDRLDLAVYYRRSVLQYRVGNTLDQDAVGGYATFLPDGDLLASLFWEGTTGDDIHALMASLSLVWRPRF